MCSYKNDQKPIVGREPRHIIYSKARDGSMNDCLTIKENLHHPDGTYTPAVRTVVNLERSFYLTKPGMRTHKDKLEYEDIANVQRYKSTEIELVNRIYGAENRIPPKRNDLRTASESPYLYGTDIRTPVLYKNRMMAEFEKTEAKEQKYNVAAMDSETDMINGTERIIMLSVTFGKRCFLAVDKNYIHQIDGYERRVKEKSVKLISKIVKENEEKLERLLAKDPEVKGKKTRHQKKLVEILKKRFPDDWDPNSENGLNIEIQLVDNDFECTKVCVDKLHEWKPDFVVFWNMVFDIEKMLLSFDNAGPLLPEDVFSDPEVPPIFRRAEWKKGANAKKTASGKYQPLHWAEQWHTFFTTSSFYFIDSGCTFRKIRVAKGIEPSYKLDYITKKYVGVGKLKFGPADHKKEGDWHILMQREYFEEYAVYNIFDNVILELLDEITLDVSTTLPFNCEYSEFSTYPSQPKRTCDQLYFELAEQQRIIASSPGDMEDELDKYVVGMEDWIVTLQPHLVESDGVRLFADAPDIISKLFTDTADLDLTGAYPWTEIISNLSKGTTRRELSRIRGVSENDKRQATINMMFARTNAYEITALLWKIPSFEEHSRMIAIMIGIKAANDVAIEDKEVA